MTMPATGLSGFYATVQRNIPGGVRTGLVLGPYDTHDEAAAHVPAARRLAVDVDPWAAFDAFGVSHVVMKPGAPLPQGTLNRRAAQPPARPAVDAYVHRNPATEGTP
jgi:hypothetical protein